MVIVNDFVKVALPGALPFATFGTERLGIALSLLSTFELRAVAGQSQIEVTEFDGDRLSKSGAQLLEAAANRVLDYLGAPRVGLQVSGQSQWVLPYGLTYDSLLAVAGTLLAAGLAPAQTLTEEELIELSVQSGAAPELAVALLRGGAALAWTKDAGRGVRYVALPAEPAGHRATLLVSKNFYAFGVDAQQFRTVNAGLLTGYLAGLAPVWAAELLTEATQMDLPAQPALAPVAQLVRHLQQLGLAALATSGGEAVLVFGKLDEQLVAQAQAAAWRVVPVTRISEGAQSASSRLD